MKTRYRGRNRTISGSVLTSLVYKRLEPDVSRMFFHAERKGGREPRSRLRLDVVFPLVPPSFFFFLFFVKEAFPREVEEEIVCCGDKQRARKQPRSR